MSIDPDAFGSPAKKGDVSGVAIDLHAALEEIAAALGKLSNNTKVDLSKEISKLKEAQASVLEQFDALTNWNADDTG